MNGRAYHNHREDPGVLQLLWQKVSGLITSAMTTLNKVKQSATHRQPGWH
jgi:hypothetical protein